MEAKFLFAQIYDKITSETMKTRCQILTFKLLRHRKSCVLNVLRAFKESGVVQTAQSHSKRSVFISISMLNNNELAQ